MKRASLPPAPGLAPVVAAALVGLGPVLPAAAVAQEDPDFLFGQPRVTFGLKGGWSQPLAGSDVFDLTRDTLTAQTTDFGSPAVGVEMGIRLNDRLDLAFDLLYTSSETRSEYRNWVDLDDNPIEQTTAFTRVPLTASLKGYLWDRGRSIGRFAWVPTKWTPYAGVGGGVVFWNFEQEGDFVDFNTFDIFTDRFVADGTAAVVHALAGVELSLGHRWLVTGEARYSWGGGDMNEDFTQFQPIDLSGFQLTIGISGRLARPGG